MLSRHIISACVSLCVCALVWFTFLFIFFLRGALKTGVKKNASVDILIFCLLRIWRFEDCARLHVWTPSAHPNETHSPCSLWPDLTLSASGGHTLMCEHRSLCPDLKGRWSFLHGRSCKGTSLWFLQGLATSVFTWSISMKVYRASCVRWWQVWI